MSNHEYELALYTLPTYYQGAELTRAMDLLDDINPEGLKSHHLLEQVHQGME